MSYYRTNDCPLCKWDKTTCALHAERPMPQWAVEYHAANMPQIEVFEAVCQGEFTASDGARILVEMRDMDKPKWLRWLLRVWRGQE